MRAVLILIAIVLVLSLAGWVTFQRAPGRAGVTIETEKIRTDSQGVVDSGAKLLNKAGNEADQQ